MKSDFYDKIYFTMINFWSWWWEVDNKKDELTRSILIIFVPIILILWYKWTASITARLPPGPYGLPVLGYLPFLHTNLHEIYTQMGHKYGQIFSLRLGYKLHVVVNSTELAKVVARELDHTFSNRQPTAAGLAATFGGLDIMWSNNNTYLRNLRKLLVTIIMNNANLEASLGLRISGVRKTVRNVYAKIGTKVDIRQVILWGGRKLSEKNVIDFDKFHEVEARIVQLLGAPNISDFIPILSCFDLQGRKREMEKLIKYIYNIFDNIIEERIKANSTRKEDETEADGMKDFLQIMLEIMDQNDASIPFDINKLKALLYDIVFASTDTSSTMAEWVMTELLHYPDVMKKVQDELTRVVGMNNIVEESHLPKLKYLDAVVKETFRLHPVAPLLIPRSPDKSCTVGGYTVPKGATVYINVWAILLEKI